MGSSRLKILLADDHPLFREGVKPLLGKLAPEVEVIEAPDYPTLLELARANPDLDLVLMDLFMPGMHGVEGVRRFRAAHPAVPVVMLSATEQPEHVHSAMDAGASGFITKSSPGEVILNALKQVLAGGTYLPPAVLSRSGPPPHPLPEYSQLTPRQRDVLRELAQGKSNRQIAEALALSEGTVRIHLAAIFRVLQVSNRTEAVLVAQKMGLPGIHPSL